MESVITSGRLTLPPRVRNAAEEKCAGKAEDVRGKLRLAADSPLDIGFLKNGGGQSDETHK